MMLVFLFGIGAACLLAAATQGAWQLAAALTLLGAFASIYHPVGIPMLVQHTTRPGAVIGVNGLVGNLGIAVAAVLTGLTVKYFGWRMAFVVPGVLSLAFGVCSPTRAARGAPPRRSPSSRPARGNSRASCCPDAHVDRQPAVQLRPTAAAGLRDRMSDHRRSALSACCSPASTSSRRSPSSSSAGSSTATR
jgi:MFS family permease